MSLDDLKKMLVDEGYTPSAACWESEDRLYACSVESVRVGAYGTHPRMEVSLKKDTQALLIGKSLYGKA